MTFVSKVKSNAKTAGRYQAGLAPIDPANPSDMTAKNVHQLTWGPENIPFVLGQLDPHPGWENEVTQDYLKDPVTGRNVLDRHGNKIKNFRAVPRRISSKVEPWRVEAMMRLHPDLTYDDICVRMPNWTPDPTPKAKNAYQMRLYRYVREKYHVRCWRTRHAKLCEVPKRLVKILDGVSNDSIKHNTTWKVTRKGIHVPDSRSVLPLDRFLLSPSHYPHTPSPEIKAALELRDKLNDKASRAGLSHWSELSKQDLPPGWGGFSRTSEVYCKKVKKESADMPDNTTSIKDKKRARAIESDDDSDSGSSISEKTAKRRSTTRRPAKRPKGNTTATPLPASSDDGDADDENEETEEAEEVEPEEDDIVEVGPDDKLPSDNEAKNDRDDESFPMDPPEFLYSVGDEDAEGETDDEWVNHQAVCNDDISDIEKLPSPATTEGAESASSAESSAEDADSSSEDDNVLAEEVHVDSEEDAEDAHAPAQHDVAPVGDSLPQYFTPSMYPPGTYGGPSLEEYKLIQGGLGGTASGHQTETTVSPAVQQLVFQPLGLRSTDTPAHRQAHFADLRRPANEPSMYQPSLGNVFFTGSQGGTGNALFTNHGLSDGMADESIASITNDNDGWIEDVTTEDFTGGEASADVTNGMYDPSRWSPTLFSGFAEDEENGDIFDMVTLDETNTL